MSDRTYAFTIILEREIGEEQTESTLNAIKALKFVLDVKPLTSNSELMFAEMTARTDLKKKLYDLLKDL